MDEPLWCWIFLLIAIGWGHCTRSKESQDALKQACGRFTPLVQWYNVTFFALLLLFLRTVWDILRFEFFKDDLLSFRSYGGVLNTNVTGIPLSPAEQDFERGPLAIPAWLRWLSLFSPVTGLFAFAYAAYQVIARMLSTAMGNSEEEEFLFMVVLGMPLLFTAMALRATIRQWAVMTGSCWLPYAEQEMDYDTRLQLWNELKAEEISTYLQDLEVAKGFQFFAVWCFGQVCRGALKDVFEARSPREKEILLQLGVVGINSFVALGVAKTVLNMVMAVASCSVWWQAAVEPVEVSFLHFIDPIFMFASALSVNNMKRLGKMEGVSEVLPNVNRKFNATRALLMIGQSQLTVLRALTIDARGTTQVLDLLHHVPLGSLQRMEWWLTMNQARLLHSSLLCYECLYVVVKNAYTWAETKEEDGKEEDGKRAPLLAA